MKKSIMTLCITGVLLMVMFTAIQLTSQLGIGLYAAKKIVDVLSAVGSVWGVLGIIGAVIGSGGIGVGLLIAAKALIKKFGKKWVTAW